MLNTFCYTTSSQKTKSNSLNCHNVMVNNVMIKLNSGVSYRMLTVQCFEALNLSAVTGIQQACNELEINHTVELQMLVSIVSMLQHRPHVKSYHN